MASEPTIADELILLLGEIKGQGASTNQKVDRLEGKVDLATTLAIENKSGLTAAHRRIDEIRPIVDNHERVLNQGQGAAKTLHIGWTVACAIISGIGFIIGMIWF